ncbi:MAG: PIN domain nuclease [Pseudomonadota bacterium]
MIVVDSSVWIDFFNDKDTRQTAKLDQILGVEPVLIGDLILTEILQGFRDDRQYAQAKNALADLYYADMVGKDIAIRSAENYRALRSKGLTVRKTIDVLIGTFCIVKSHHLLHADRDFDPMEQHLDLKCL